MKTIDDLSSEYAELKEYSTAQFQVISDLNKKIQKLEEENAHLKVLLEQNTQSVGSPIELLSTDEETACKVQIKMLRDVSLKRELTLEEARKLEIYTKLLLQIKNTPKKKQDEAKTLDSDALLALVEDNKS